MFQRTLIALVLFLLPLFSYAETIPFTSDQTLTEQSMTIEEDGLKFNLDATATYNTFFLDNALPTVNATVTALYSYDVSNCATNYPFLRIQWAGVGTFNIGGGGVIPTTGTGQFEEDSDFINSTTNQSEYWKYYTLSCDTGSWITLHALYYGTTTVFEYATAGGGGETASSTVLMPPTYVLSLLATSTCNGTSTSSVCTFEYATSTATSTSAVYLNYILEHLQTAFIYAVWLTMFCLILGVILLFIRGRHGYY